MISPTVDMKQVHARAVQTLAKGVQIDLSTTLCKRYLRRHAGHKTSLVVLYVDIDGSTKMTLSLPSNDLALVLQLFSQEMSIVAGNFGGYVLKYVGDAVIVVFPAEHDRQQACTSAFECGRMMLEVIDGAINPALFGRGMPGIKVKVSMDLGEVLVVLYGKSLENSHIDIIGSNISMAAKMLPLVPTGRIIMGQTFRGSLPERLTKGLAQFDVAESLWSYIGQDGRPYRLYLAPGGRAL
jgi:class 3 adenylate cyclase